MERPAADGMAVVGGEAVQNEFFERANWGALEVEFLDVATDTAKFDLTFVVQGNSKGLVARVEYNTEKKVWMWHEATTRFVPTENISDLVTTLEDAAKTSKGGAGGATCSRDSPGATGSGVSTKPTFLTV